MAFETKSDHIVWSHEYNIPEFLATYSKKLPQVVKVTQGFHGDYLVDSISTNDIILVEKCSKQKRVLGQDVLDRPLSIAVNFCPELELVQHDETLLPPAPLKTLLDSNPLPFRVRFPSQPVPTSPKEDLNIIRLNSVLTDRYLLVNCILMDKLESIVRMIQENLDDVRFIVATGFDRRRFDWTEFTTELSRASSLLDYNGITGASHVAISSQTGSPVYENQEKCENKNPDRKISAELGELRDKSVSKFKKVVSDFKKHVNKGHTPKKGATTYEDLDLHQSKRDSQLDSYEEINIGPKVKTKVLRKSASVDCANETEGNCLNPKRPLLPTRTDLGTVRSGPTIGCDSSGGGGKNPTKTVPAIAPKPKFKLHGPKLTDRSNDTASKNLLAKTQTGVDSDKHLQLSHRERYTQEKTQEFKNTSSNLREKPKMSVKPLTTDSADCAPLTNRITHFSDVPIDLSPMKTEEIVDCLRLLQLDDATINMFENKRLDGCFLNLISEEDFREFLQKETELSLIDRERTVNFLKKGWRPS